jgi:clan AA aspartic protease
VLTGHIDPLRRPMVSIWVEGPYGTERVETLIDTGFNGFLSLPRPIISRLGLKPYGPVLRLSADGTLSSGESFTASVRWVSGLKSVIALASPIETAMVGTRLLDGFFVELDFGHRQTVQIR